MSQKRLEEILQHTGIKGMKWGQHKSEVTSGKERKPGRLRQEWDSAKRERSWKKIVDNVHTLTTKEIGIVSKRAGLENEMKRLSKTGSDKKNYRLRAKMSDEELNRKVARLRAIHSITSQSDAASKRQRDIGKRIAQTGASLALKAYLAKKAGNKLTASDIFDAVSSAKSVKDQVIRTVIKSI